MRLEENFRLYDQLLPRSGNILDLGCGYGYITYMLMLTSDERNLTGVDYDQEKIIVAQNGYLRNKRIEFIHCNISEYPFTLQDGILLGDVLHYLPPDSQVTLIQSCMQNLKAGGVLLIREGNADLHNRHKRTRFSEFLSTRILQFNKTNKDQKKLWFISSEEVKRVAQSKGLECTIIDQGKRSSNIFIVISKPTT